MTMPLEPVLPDTSSPSLVHTPSISEKCGVFAMVSQKSTHLGALLYYGLYALQHRGQESCGMAVFDNDYLRIHKDMGLVNQVFSQSVLDKMHGQVGLGHTRYSTTGGSHFENAQPVIARSPLGALVLAHNGNLINTSQLVEKFKPDHGEQFAEDSDSHILARCIAAVLMEAGGSLQMATKQVLDETEGAYSLVIALGDRVVAARDPYGLRPFVMGRMEDGTVVFASETCALDIVGAEFERDIKPGEIIVARRDGSMQSMFVEGKREKRFCVFEMVYFARPDSVIESKSVYQARLELGRLLARKDKNSGIEADFVIPVPDSGNVAAVGYSQASGIPYMEGLIKNRYVGRTFIHPTQEMRERSIRLKLNPLPDVIAGKRIVVIDDSIVRGNTSRRIVKMLKDCGVQSVHFRVSSAPVKHPCFYGIDMSSRDQLMANKMTLDEIREYLEVDSLEYLTPQDMHAASGFPFKPCMACFDADYPAGVPADFDEEPATACGS